MFKVGDKGKTRGGDTYEVVSINHNAFFPIRVVGSDGGHSTHLPTGHWLRGEESDLDLMPPDSHHYNTDNECGPDKEEVEMPECDPDDCAHNFDMAELVQLAAQAARDNPDLTVTLDPEIRAIHFHA